jgi:hypothetical protein
MKTEFLPSLQEIYNRDLQKFLRRLAWAISVLLVCAVLGLVYLGARGAQPPPPEEARLYGPDSADLGAVFLVSQDLALADGEIPANSQISFHGEDRSAVRVIRTEQITDGTKLTLVRLTAPAPVEMVPPAIGILQAGDQITPRSSSETWQATLVARPDGLFGMQPAPPFSGSAEEVTSVRDGSLVGIVASQEGQIVVVPMRCIEDKFPEISSAQ